MRLRFDCADGKSVCAKEKVEGWLERFSIDGRQRSRLVQLSRDPVGLVFGSK